jgi:UDP-glucose 4-epimerase
VIELMAAGHGVVIIENLCNSKASVLDRMQRTVDRRPRFEQIDVRDRPALRKLFANQRFDSVIHFAGLKAVGESVQKPLQYYDNNVSGSLALVECMFEAG